MPKLFTGRCLCGTVRYECSGPVTPATFCHCESCRRASGAHLVGWATVPKDTYRVTSGSVREYASSPPVLRTFCPVCGSPLTYWNSGSAETLDITIATLEDPGALEPRDHIWMQDACTWDRPADGRAQFLRSRQDPT